MEKKIQLESKMVATLACNTVGLTPEAVSIIAKLRDSTGISARTLVSDIIVQAHEKGLIEIVEKGGLT